MTSKADHEIVDIIIASLTGRGYDITSALHTKDWFSLTVDNEDIEVVVRRASTAPPPDVEAPTVMPRGWTPMPTPPRPPRRRRVGWRRKLTRLLNMVMW